MFFPAASPDLIIHIIQDLFVHWRVPQLLDVGCTRDDKLAMKATAALGLHPRLRYKLPHDWLETLFVVVSAYERVLELGRSPVAGCWWVETALETIKRLH
ncbi:hypothetical protein Tco_0506350 [Tanacetum coccineum]